MSYDLDFVRHVGDARGFADLVRVANELPFLKRIDDNALIYDNPETGVHFTIDADAYAADSPPEYPNGYEYGGGSFSLNLIRASFFAYEAMPIAVELARAAGLSIYDLQSGAICSDAPQLIDGWLKSNAEACAIPGLARPLSMPHEKALAYWRYQKDRARLAVELAGEDVFVPTLFLFRPAGSNQVQTALTWTDGVNMIVPPADWAVVVRSKKSWFRRKQEVGYLSSAELMRKIGPHLRPFRDTGLQILEGDHATAVAEILNTIELKLGLARFQRITPDEFIDVEA